MCTNYSFVGWRVQNDGKILMDAIGKCESCSNLDLSYNGLGDNEADALGKALKVTHLIFNFLFQSKYDCLSMHHNILISMKYHIATTLHAYGSTWHECENTLLFLFLDTSVVLQKNYSGSKKPFAGVSGANIFGTIVKLNLSNNHIHFRGMSLFFPLQAHKHARAHPHIISLAWATDTLTWSIFLPVFRHIFPCVCKRLSTPGRKLRERVSKTEINEHRHSLYLCKIML